MKLATTTADFQSSMNPAKSIPYFHGTGFQYLDYSFYQTAKKGSVYLEPGDEWKREVEEAKETADRLGLSFVQAHAPDGEHFIEGEEREALLLATRRSIEGCAILGIPSTVVHAAQHPDPDATPSDFIAVNLKFYQELYATAERFGVNLLIENSAEQNTPRYYLRTGKEMKEFIQRAGHPLLHACWDTGHANMRGMDQYQSILDLGEDLYAVHIQDNYGEADVHFMPFMGSCNFDQVLQGLQDIGYKGAFTFESGSTLRARSEWPCRRKTFEYGGREVVTLLDPPVHLRQCWLRLLFETGKYMLEQYGCFEG